MGHAATKPDKVNIGITKNFRDQNLVICNVIIINSIQKYQHFLFEVSNLGTVKVQEVANRPFTELNLLKTKRADIFEEIRSLSILVLTPPPLDYKRQEYLYHNICPFVK